MPGGAPSLALLDRALRAVASGCTSTARVAARLRIHETTAGEALDMLRAAKQIRRLVLRHWRRAPERGTAEWVWRLP